MASVTVKMSLQTTDITVNVGVNDPINDPINSKETTVTVAIDGINLKQDKGQETTNRGKKTTHRDKKTKKWGKKTQCMGKKELTQLSWKLTQLTTPDLVTSSSWKILIIEYQKNIKIKG